MTELFVMDLKNYDPNGTVGRRPSVRGIIIRNGRIAMMHSCRYDYYKLPGGGIEPGESLEETLVREVQEESGLVVKKDTIREFGLYRWDDESGEDKVIKENDHAMDDIRYFTNTIMRHKVRQAADAASGVPVW